MKAIKYIILLFFVIALQSCEKMTGGFDEVLKQKENSSKVENEDVNDSVKNTLQDRQYASNIIAIDSLRAVTDSLTNEIQNQEDKLSQLNEDIKKIKDEKVGLKQLFWYCLAAIVLITLIVILVVRKIILSKEDIRRIVRSECRSYMPQLESSSSSGGNSNVLIMNKLNGNIARIDNDINALKLRVDQFENKKVKPESIDPPLPPLPPENPSVFYINKPAKERVAGFMDANKSLTQGQETLYVFTLEKHNSNRASFVFNPNNQNIINMAINYHQDFIDPVCDMENIRQGAQIKCVPGKVELIDGIWKVTKKAKIYC